MGNAISQRRLERGFRSLAVLGSLCLSLALALSLAPAYIDVLHPAVADAQQSTPSTPTNPILSGGWNSAGMFVTKLSDSPSDLGLALLAWAAVMTAHGLTALIAPARTRRGAAASFSQRSPPARLVV